jgi:hypothetical protein
MQFRSRFPFLVVVVTGMMAWSEVACAQDFRVDSKVFSGSESAPHSTNITLFRGHHVYDFLDKPQQVTFYDLDRGRIVMVDPQRRLKVEVSRTMLDAFANNLRHMEGKTNDTLLRFALRPSFDERDGKGKHERIFASKPLTYQVQTQPEEADGMAAAYRGFGDASARLNSDGAQRVIGRSAATAGARTNDRRAAASVRPLGQPSQ